MRDSEKAEELIAYLKQEVVGKDISSESEIQEVIHNACDKFDALIFCVKSGEQALKKVYNRTEKSRDLVKNTSGVRRSLARI